MYKVKTQVLQDTAKILDKLVKYLHEEEKHYKEEPSRGHIYHTIVKAKKQSKLIKDYLK